MSKVNITPIKLRCSVCNGFSSKPICNICEKYATEVIDLTADSEEEREAAQSLCSGLRPHGTETESDDSPAASQPDTQPVPDEGSCSREQSHHRPQLNPLKRTIAFFHGDSPDEPHCRAPRDSDEQVVTYNLCNECDICGLSNGYHSGRCPNFGLSSARDASFSDLSPVLGSEGGSLEKGDGTSYLGPSLGVGSCSSGTPSGWEPSFALPSYPAAEVLYAECEVCRFCWQSAWQLSSRAEHEKLFAVRSQRGQFHCPQCGCQDLIGETRFYFQFGCPNGDEWINIGCDRPGIPASGFDASPEIGGVHFMEADEDYEDPAEGLDGSNQGSDPACSDPDDCGLDQWQYPDLEEIQTSPINGDWATEHGEDWLDRALECLSFHLLHSN